MKTVEFDPTVTHKSGRRKVVTRMSPPPNPRIGEIAVAVASVGLVAVLILGAVSESSADLRVPGGLAMFVGGMAGLAGMYLALIMVLLVSRIPVLERILGQDGLVRWHRRLGPWPISLLVAHAVIITIGFAQTARTGPLQQFAAFIRSYPDMLAATVGLGLMIMAAVASVRALRNRMRRETWWVIHLYMYLALALSFAHVLALGPTFVGHPLTRALWSLLWLATAGTVIVYRFCLPLARSFRHHLRVVEVHDEAPGVVSIICSGRHLDRLAISGGQFFQWRFLARGLWWQAHPYSLSALPRPPYLRLTVRQIGDHSSAIARLPLGTRVAIEGPYGAITPHARTRYKVVLFAGGVGITALRSLLEDLPKGSDPIVLMRASSEDQLILRDEVAELVRRLNGSLHELVGPRSEVGDARQILRRLVPDLALRDVFVCGPKGFVQQAVAAAHSLGSDPTAVHYEVFSW
jgi:predicted ferric reductase